ncbi:hypothetical protein TSUD_137690 [Trifolium subterraneum]|uniref:Post-SET domain-containing protein n=1 Tax=Trifolium subterraneum TaxID=3900 RepID=A0A2Z6NY06_TRISU|nr:hypothetical protein TSUD_137690 [Trifolium subterraneum]
MTKIEQGIEKKNGELEEKTKEQSSDGELEEKKFVQFGPEVKCRCGAQKCQGFLALNSMLARVLKLSSDSSLIGDGMKLKVAALLSFIKSYLDGDESSDEDDVEGLSIGF